MDHAPTLITQTTGSGTDGSDVGLHGGAQGSFNPTSYCKKAFNATIIVLHFQSSSRFLRTQNRSLVV